MQQVKENIFNYLNENATSSEQQEVENWISESLENREVFEEVKKLHNLSSIDEVTFSPDVNAAWDKVSKELFESKKNNVIQMNFGFIFKIAAMLTLAIGLGYFYFSNQTNLNVLATLDNQIQKIELVDGTIVWVNENTTFKYPEEFSNDKREVYLEGEAFFEVSKNLNKPFVIRSYDTYTQVLGTSFNLNTSKSNSDVNVVTGKVAFVLNSDNNNKVILSKGERGVLKEGRIEKSSEFDANTMAWKTKELVFKSTELKEVVLVLNDYYNVNIELDKNISNCLITSTFNQKSIEEVFEILNIIAKIENTQSDGVYRLSGPGC